MYYVYLIVANNKDKLISYVGFTNNIKRRVELHNKSKGAKFTRGRIWKIAYYKKYNSKKKALKDEYKLKKNYRLRNIIKSKFLK